MINQLLCKSAVTNSTLFMDPSADDDAIVSRTELAQSHQRSGDCSLSNVSMKDVIILKMRSEVIVILSTIMAALSQISASLIDFTSSRMVWIENSLSKVSSTNSDNWLILEYCFQILTKAVNVRSLLCTIRLGNPFNAIEITANISWIMLSIAWSICTVSKGFSKLLKMSKNANAMKYFY